MAERGGCGTTGWVLPIKRLSEAWCDNLRSRDEDAACDCADVDDAELAVGWIELLTLDVLELSGDEGEIGVLPRIRVSAGVFIKAGKGKSLGLDWEYFALTDSDGGGMGETPLRGGARDIFDVDAEGTCMKPGAWVCLGDPAVLSPLDSRLLLYMLAPLSRFES